MDHHCVDCPLHCPVVSSIRRALTEQTFPLARNIHDYLCEAFETETRRGCPHVRSTQAYAQAVEEAERETPRRTKRSDDGAGGHQLSGLGFSEQVC